MGRRSQTFRLPTKACVLLATCVFSFANSAVAADARRSEQFARQWCQGCHATRPGQRSPNPRAPSLLEVYRRNPLTSTQFALFLSLPQKMPGRRVTLEEAANIAAYLESHGR